MSDTAQTLPNPEVSWTRLKSVPEIDAPFLESHLSAWPELLNRKWDVLPGGLRSLNLRSGTIVARIALDPVQNLQKEAALLRLVRPAVRVPKVIDISAGALLLEYVPVCDLPATEEAGFSVGSAAAYLHSQRFSEAGLIDEKLNVFRRFESTTRGLEEFAAETLATPAEELDSTRRKVQRLWKETVYRLETSYESPVLVHSDFKPANIKWSATENRAVVFDWEFAWAGPSLFDVGQLFRWYPQPAFVDGFESGYRTGGGRLHDTWLEDAEIFDLLNLVDFLSRTPVDPVRTRDVLARISETLERH